MIGQTLSHFRITAKLGEGGMGEVYRAEDTKLGREVAIKVLPRALSDDPERMARFEREAQILASLNHTNVAAIYEVGQAEIADESVDFLVMELVEGETLGERMERGAIPFEDALPIALQIAEGLEAAHQRGIVHRDLKPANVMVSPRGEVKVLDFGLAKAWEGPSEASPDMTASPTLTAQMTQAGMILGTAAYMSPEQARGEETDQRADVWAFGVILWEMLTGRRLFAEPTVSDTLAAVLRADLDLDALPPETPWNIRQVLELCLERNHQNRLHAIADARLGLSANRPPPPSTPASSTRSRPWGLITLAVIGLVAAVGFASLWLGEQKVPRRMTRLSIVPAAGTRLDVGQGLAVSPDGSKIVFVARDESGKPRLYLRAIDVAEPTVVTGSTGASSPFWSPDGAQIGFFVDEKLKRVAASGGPPQTICDVSGPRGGTWGPQGVIVFSGGQGGGRGVLHRVSASGGSPTALTQLDEGRPEFSHRWPSFLPNGTHVVFVAQTGEGSVENDTSTIEVLSLESGKRSVVLSANSSVAYVPSGHLLFWRQGSVLAQAFDPRTFEVSGDTTVILEGVGYTPAEFASFSASAEGTLVYQAGTLQESIFSWFDRDGVPMGTIGEPATVLVFPRISWDGSRIAYEFDDDIWVRDLARGTETRLTFANRDGHPTWSPDDQWVAFSSTREPWGIYRKRASGIGEVELLFAFERDAITGGVPTAWSADGNSIVGWEYDSETAMDVFRLDVAEGKLETLLNTPFFERDPSLSPDGNWLAYVSDETDNAEIYVLRLTGIGGRWQLSVGGGTRPVWSRDGDTIYYLSVQTDQLMAVEVETGETFHASAPVALMGARVRPGGFGFDVSADEQRFLLNLRVGGSGEAEPLSVIQNWPELLRENR